MNPKNKYFISLFLLASWFFPVASKANTVKNDPLTIAKKRCHNTMGSSAVPLYSSDFHWNMTLQSMAQKYLAIYQSEKRLPLHVFYENDNFYAPSPLQESADILLPTTFIISIIQHIEEALAGKYADFIFFPDMGHGHFFIPQEYYESQIATIEVGNENYLYEKIISHPKVKILYHTAEQLQVKGEEGQLLEDRYLQWRFYTRNLLGRLDSIGLDTVFPSLTILQNLSSKGNAVHELPGHRYYAGINISASAQGCFPFTHQGQIYYFDISFKDLEPEFPAADE